MHTARRDVLYPARVHLTPPICPHVYAFLMRVRVPAANYQAVDEVLARFRELDRSKTGYISKEDCQFDNPHSTRSRT